MTHDTISRVLDRYYHPLMTALFGVSSVVLAAAAGSLAGLEANINSGTEKVRTVKYSDVFDIVHEQRVKFAAVHGVADPAALVAAVRHSAMANLLISVAIEESRGDPVAVGSAGEQGAWQVIASDWGSVPKDMIGQAIQAERIIRALLADANGDKRKALARYNGGPTPPGKSYRYAERILKRARHLQVAVNYLPPKEYRLRTAAL
ncbi:MAG: lytic transglycosylase domain-containing protein [Desulfuromonadaceae bacterium]|nr:lytic transglycosylase domain-containing protein [Desulfuromonadaceae bacterium]